MMSRSFRVAREQATRVLSELFLGGFRETGSRYGAFVRLLRLF